MGTNIAPILTRPPRPGMQGNECNCWQKCYVLPCAGMRPSGVHARCDTPHTQYIEIPQHVQIGDGRHHLRPAILLPHRAGLGDSRPALAMKVQPPPLETRGNPGQTLIPARFGQGIGLVSGDHRGIEFTHLGV